MWDFHRFHIIAWTPQPPNVISVLHFQIPKVAMFVQHVTKLHTVWSNAEVWEFMHRMKTSLLQAWALQCTTPQKLMCVSWDYKSKQQNCPLQIKNVIMALHINTKINDSNFFTSATANQSIPALLHGLSNKTWKQRWKTTETSNQRKQTTHPKKGKPSTLCPYAAFKCKSVP